ncbi:molybdopterin molybdotransferase MoeA [Corynebacterium sp. A21]|uniref:molybdopterin molybdotransferase MoeA n=1 Tax=Corynebacterium sp. A21 TaxID=3457318 RepID=UPI003FD4E243
MTTTPRSMTEHLTALQALVPQLQPQQFTPVRAAGLVLAEDARAELPVPPFSNSAVDGFLVRAGDLSGTGPWELPVAGDVPAGAEALALPAESVLRIMTGAPVGEPPAVDLRVVPVESSDIPRGPAPLPSRVLIAAGDHNRSHIRRRGEDTAAGEVVATAGSLIDPGTLAALISTGIGEISAYPRPRVTVISSGDELVAAGEIPGPGQLPDSNLPMVAALLRAAGITEISTRHVADSAAQFRFQLDQASQDSDLVITTGGVSAGAFDVVREVAEDPSAEDSEMWFGPVDMQPGKPQGLGLWRGTPLVCLPGNPVAVFVSFHLFLTPLLQLLAGHSPQSDPLDRPMIQARAGATFPMPGSRPLVVPVRLDWSRSEAVATPFTPGGKGSHRVASLAGVNGLVVLAPQPPEAAVTPEFPVPQAGEPIQVLLLR